ncbi:MAG: heparinase II/III family protein [Bacteroidia bacterium]
MPLQSLSLLSLLVLLLLSCQDSKPKHPYIFVNNKEYPSLQEKSQIWPWSSMKRKADSLFQASQFTGEEDYFELCSVTIPVIASTAGLLYILDPSNSDIYRAKVEDDLAKAWKIVHAVRDTMTNGHGSSVPPSHAAFYTYLVLDIMHDKLNPEIRKKIESHCAFIADRHLPKWNASEYAIKAMKELYHHGKTPEFERLKDLYRNHILSLTSSDGVYTTGPGYAFSRLYMDQRIQKKIFMDVCEYQGYHEFYSDTTFQHLYEWVFGYIHTPFNRSYTFGDTPPRKTFEEWSVAALRVHRFSALAQQHARWFLGPYTETSVKGDLIHYLLYDSLPQAATPPLTRTFANGGAWLIQQPATTDAFAGAIWNIKTTKENHNHRDVNAIHIAAYGEHILRNSGYNEWQGPDPERWQFLHEMSESSNTVSIDSVNHQYSHGGGITSSLSGENLAWASGSSGEALTNGHHQRNFFLIQPQPNTAGYFALIDEVRSQNPERKVNITFHPNSASLPRISSNGKIFTWPVEGCNYSGKPVEVTIATVASAISHQIKTGYLGSVSAYQFPYTEPLTQACGEFEGKYLYSTYPTDDHGITKVITLIFPHPALDPIPRISTHNTTAVIDHGDGIADYILGPTANDMVQWEGRYFQGKWIFFREMEGNLSFWMAEEAVKFQSGEWGFESDKPVTIFMENDQLTIISPGTQIKIRYPGFHEFLQQEGKSLTHTSGDGWMKVYAEKGKNLFRIVPVIPDNAARK